MNGNAGTDFVGDGREMNGNAGTDFTGGGREMNGNAATDFEVALVVPKKCLRDKDSGRDCIDFLVSELQKAGLIVERVAGLSDEFLKLAATLKVLGKAATELQIKKLTYIAVTLTFDGKEFMWEIGESLLKKMELEGIVKQVFPVHDETKRKLLLRKWALNWLDFTWQPIDEIYAYFGTKVENGYAANALLLLHRWLINHPVGLETSDGVANDGVANDGVVNCVQSNVEIIENQLGTEKPRDEEYRREEWFEWLLRFRNDAIVVLGIIFLQLPFELAYAHLYEIAESDVMRSNSVSLRMSIAWERELKFWAAWIRNGNTESSADSLVYKVFGLYFMQSYIGLFYHAVVYRNVLSLRQVLIQRLIVSQVLENLLENSIPYLKYSYKKYRAVQKRKGEKGSAGGKMVQLASRVEKEYLKPSYTASIGEELEDGLFDGNLSYFTGKVENNITEIRTDALKLLVMMRRPIPRAAASIGAWLNIFQPLMVHLGANFPVGIDGLNSVGAEADHPDHLMRKWISTTFLIVMAICTNCALLVCLYDKEGKWSIEPGLAAILIIEHVLLLIKFGFSHFVPEKSSDTGFEAFTKRTPAFSDSAAMVEDPDAVMGIVPKLVQFGDFENILVEGINFEI
ncbi:hypothetical protein ACLOJK_019886 [Asimina triloba]